MDRTEALLINDWELLLKQKHEPFPQLFYASNCTENQAFNKLDQEFTPSNRYVLHIREHGSYSFKTYNDKKAQLHAWHLHYDYHYYL